MRYLLISNDPAMLYRYRAEVIMELLKKNSVYVCAPKGDVDDLISIGCEMVYADVDRRGMDPRADLALYKAYKRIISEVKPDIVLTYSIKPNIYGGYAAKKLGVPYFAHVQGLGSAFQKKILKAIVSLMYRSALKDAKGVFFENTGNRDLFVNGKIICKDQAITVKGGAGVPLESFPFCELLQNDTVNFLFVGRIMKEKGVDELFDAAKRMKAELGSKVSFTIAGNFVDEYEKTVKELSDSGIIEYVGFVKDVASLYRKCHAVVLPSYHEGLANVLIEGAATGRALIATNIHGCKETIVDNESGYLVPVRDTESLYTAMMRFYDLSFEKKQKMGISGRNFVEKCFNRKDVVEFTVASLEEGLK